MSEVCADIRGRLSWFVGGDLDRVTAAMVAEHLTSCLSCRREAASLQQAQRALSRAGSASMQAGVVPGADEAMFAAMHERIMTSALAEAPTAAPVDGAHWTRALWVAAASLLFGIGWWLVHEPAPVSMLDRQPIPLAEPTADGVPRAQPWAGPRARTQLLEHFEAVTEDGDDGVFGAPGGGMLQRLRTLEDEAELLAPRIRRKD